MSYSETKKNLNYSSLTGRTEEHLVEFAGVRIHAGVLEALQALQVDAAAAGFELGIASAFRSFERQCLIWNDKVAGRRPVLDDAGNVLKPDDLSAEDLVFAILRWSALPGASRHHWGTDVDVYDRKAMLPGYQLQLTVAETIAPGPFAPLHLWLNEYLAGSSTNFFRPYTRPFGGVAPEPWHLSCAAVAAPLQKALTPELVRDALNAAPIELKDTVLRFFDEIFERFVWVPWSLYPHPWCSEC